MASLIFIIEIASPDFAGWRAYAGAMHQSGVVVNGHGLQDPSTSTSIRVRGDKRQVQEGPFADTKEQLGSYFVIETTNLDAALEWAAYCLCLRRYATRFQQRQHT